MNARARVNRVVDSPIRAFSSIRQWSWNFFETWVQGEIVADGILGSQRMFSGGANERFTRDSPSNPLGQSGNKGTKRMISEP